LVSFVICILLPLTSVADPYIYYTDPDPDPDPALFSIYGSGSRSRLFDDTKIIFSICCSKKDSSLFHISFDYEGIPLKEMKKMEKTSNKSEKSLKSV